MLRREVLGVSSWLNTVWQISDSHSVLLGLTYHVTISAGCATRFNRAISGTRRRTAPIAFAIEGCVGLAVVGNLPPAKPTSRSGVGLIMKRDLIWCLSGLLLCLAVADSYAAAVDGPYQDIAKRNAFNLKQLPEQIPPEIIPPLPKFRLTGIVTRFGEKRAFLKMQVANPPVESVDDRSLVLSQGQREGEIEILDIDQKLGSVKILWAGRPLTLRFEEATSQRPRVMPQKTSGRTAQ